jgi:hypothetical protein
MAGKGKINVSSRAPVKLETSYMGNGEYEYSARIALSFINSGLDTNVKRTISYPLTKSEYNALQKNLDSNQGLSHLSVKGNLEFLITDENSPGSGQPTLF